jgi:hypothetical protein
MNEFKPGEEVAVSGSVLRTRDGLVEIQLGDGQLLRVPLDHAVRAPEEKAMKEPAENKAETRAPENKSARPKQQSGGNNSSKGTGRQGGGAGA